MNPWELIAKNLMGQQGSGGPLVEHKVRSFQSGFMGMPTQVATTRAVQRAPGLVTAKDFVRIRAGGVPKIQQDEAL